MKFKKNEGVADRIVRAVVGIVILALGLQYQSWWGLIGLVPLFTAVTGYCHLYKIMGWKTN